MTQTGRNAGGMRLRKEIVIRVESDGKLAWNIYMRQLVRRTAGRNLFVETDRMTGTERRQDEEKEKDHTRGS